MNATILVVDDDHEILTLLSKYLTQQGYAVREAASLKEMRQQLAAAAPDLVVLDIMLPDGSGLDACLGLRHEGVRLPIILLTAMQEEVDRIIGLEMGADDYMGKPFNPRELLARIKAVLRRSAEAPQAAPESGRHAFEGFQADPAARTVTAPDGSDLQLTGAEFEVLRIFLDRPGRIISRDQILEMTRGRNGDPFDRSVDVLMSRIRKKLRDAGGPADVIKTVRNGGYQFAAKVSAIP